MTKHSIKRILSILLLTTTLSAPSAGGLAGNPVAAPPVPTADIAAIAAKIAGGVGVVQKTVPAGDKAPIFVFEEYHTSRVGQLQIATMLLRLHDVYGLRKIGLEGAMRSPKAIDASRFHQAGGQTAKSDREDIAVRMLAEGEINSAEFMALAFPDVEVRGIELAEEYNVTLDVKSSPELGFLLGIAQKTFPRQSIPELNRLVESGDKNAAVEFLLSQDPWVKATYASLNDRSSSISCEQQAARMAGIQKKARSVGANIEAPTRQAADRAAAFYETCGRRSRTMVDSVLNLRDPEPNSPIAMQIGAGHTNKVVELLQQNHAAFCVIRPIALNPGYANLSRDQFKRKEEAKYVRNSPGTLGRVLNAGRKPPPIIGTATGDSLASMYLASLWIAKQARIGRDVPGTILGSISNLPGLRIDRNSFELHGYDVVFHAWLKDNQGGEKSVWARVGSLSSQKAAITLEQKLQQAISDLTETGGGDGGARIPPTERPPNSEPAKDEGPRDTKRGDRVISRIGRQELAVYAESRDDLIEMSDISN